MLPFWKRRHKSIASYVSILRWFEEIWTIGAPRIQAQLHVFLSKIYKKQKTKQPKDF